MESRNPRWFDVFSVQRIQGQREEWDCFIYMGDEQIAGPFYGFTEARDWARDNYRVYIDKEFEKILLVNE